MDKKVSIKANGTDITFNVTLAAHDKYITEMHKGGNLPAAANNFLTRCVDPKSKDALSPLLKMPQVPMVIVSTILEDYVPDVTIELKK